VCVSTRATGRVGPGMRRGFLLWEKGQTTTFG
jgi:hypothetical protein